LQYMAGVMYPHPSLFYTHPAAAAATAMMYQPMPFSSVTNAMQMQPERSSGSQASYNSTVYTVGNDVNTQYSTQITRPQITRDKSTCIAGPAGNGGASVHNYQQDPTRCLSFHNTRPIAPSLLTGNIRQGRTWVQCGAFGYIEKGGARLTDGLPNRRRLHIRSAKQSNQHQGRSNIQIGFEIPVT